MNATDLSEWEIKIIAGNNENMLPNNTENVEPRKMDTARIEKLFMPHASLILYSHIYSLVSSLSSLNVSHIYTLKYFFFFLIFILKGQMVLRRGIIQVECLISMLYFKMRRDSNICILYFTTFKFKRLFFLFICKNCFFQIPIVQLR